MQAATDMASSGIMPLDQAVKTLSQSYSGNLGQLKKIAPELDGLTKKELEKRIELIRDAVKNLKNVEVDDKDATLEDKFVIEAVKIAEKRLGESGRGLLRKSGTEPVLRVMSEADKLESANNAVDYIIDSMKRNNHLKNIRR